MKKYVLLLLAAGFLLTNCKKNDDGPVDPVVKEEPKKVADYPVQDFMWQAMNAYYFWQADVTDLADARFSSEEEYAEFLSKEADPETFFYKICNKHEEIVGENGAVDRFSFVAENYKDLVQSFQGISKSNGVEFGLSLYGSGEDVFGFVRYIVPGSDADGKDIKRGDIFIGINGTGLNLSNYQSLLFGTLDSYTMNMAVIENNAIAPNGKTVALTKQAGLAENPILIKKVITEGNNKIGYLLYNSFIADYDEQLNDAFGEFKSAGINELILDFRYNGGGRVSSAIQIASSVYGTNTNELFLRARYNEKIQAELEGSDVEENFVSRTLAGTAINALNLPRVYVITSSATASASELVINGLEPYVNVVQIGTKTVGKNEFSITFVDDLQNGFFYDETRENNINPKNQWAIQPLLGRNENAEGFSDYTNGLLPDHELREDLANMGILGDVQEPLLALALNVINGTSAKRNFEPVYPLEILTGSSERKKISNKMLMDGLLAPMANK